MLHATPLVVTILAALLVALVIVPRLHAGDKTPGAITAKVDEIMARNHAVYGGGFAMLLKLGDVIEKKRQALKPLLDERAVHTGRITKVREACENDGERAPTAEETATVTAARAEVARIDGEIAPIQAEIAQLQKELDADEAADKLARDLKPSGAPKDRQARDRAPVTVTGEERTYSAEKSARGEASFFVDAYGAQRGNSMARSRLERNLAEAIAEGEISERATTTGSFAGLVVPQYLIDQAAVIARAGRPFANAVQHQQLPEQGMALIVPRGTTGASAAVQATENAAVSETDEVWSNLTVPVVTVAGQQKVSRQTLERGTPGMDELIYADLVGAHAVALDQQVISGTGTSGQMLGVVNTAGVNQATAFTAAVTPQTYYSKLAGIVSAIQTSRFMAPTLIAGAPRRWNWLVSAFDAQNRPLVVPRSNGPMNALGVWDSPTDTPSPEPVGELQGLPFVTDASIPLSVGTGPEDLTIVARREDLILWEEGNGLPKQLRFDEPLGNQLESILVIYSYAAFTAGRYPSAVGIIGGNSGAGFGTVAPTF